MASGGEEEDFSWLSSYFSQLVAQAREHWIPLGRRLQAVCVACVSVDALLSRAETAREFLTRGAKKAVDIIYNAVGPVGPPIRPGSGSLFIVDERRLHAWREDG